MILYTNAADKARVGSLEMCIEEKLESRDAGRRMRIGAWREEKAFQRDALGLVTLLILVALVAAYPQAMALLEGRKESVMEAGIGLRLFREGILVLLLLRLGIHLMLIRNRFVPSLTNILAVIITSLWMLLAFGATILRGYDPVVPLSGLRFIQYSPLILVAYLITKRTGMLLFCRLSLTVKLFLLISLPIALYQVLIAPPVQGKTAFGSRAFGTFSEANVFGVMMAACALALLAEQVAAPRIRYKSWAMLGWIPLCVVLAFLSGSRTAMILALFVAAYPLFMVFRLRLDRLVLASAAVPFLLGVFLLVSQRMFSGRATVVVQEARIGNWLETLTVISSPWDLIVGWGMGLGSNTLSTVFGYNTFHGQFIADSHYIFLLGSFGIVGVILFVLFLLNLAFTARSEAATLVTVFILLIGIPFLPFELFPINVILFLLWGALLGLRLYVRQDQHQVFTER